MEWKLSTRPSNMCVRVFALANVSVCWFWKSKKEEIFMDNDTIWSKEKLSFRLLWFFSFLPLMKLINAESNIKPKGILIHLLTHFTFHQMVFCSFCSWKAHVLRCSLSFQRLCTELPIMRRLQFSDRILFKFYFISLFFSLLLLLVQSLKNSLFSPTETILNIVWHYYRFGVWTWSLNELAKYANENWKVKADEAHSALTHWLFDIIRSYVQQLVAHFLIQQSLLLSKLISSSLFT